MTPPTPDRAAADREALKEWRASRGHVWDREGCQEYSEAAYLAGAEHGRADYDETFARACRRYEGAEERELAVRRELERTKRELQSWKDGEQGEIAALIKQERKLRSDLATARADLEHARKARKGFQELYEASCRDVVANCERAEKAEDDLARVEGELVQANSNAEVLRALARRLGDERDKARLADPSHPAYARGVEVGRKVATDTLLRCAEDWSTENQTLADWVEHARKRHGGGLACQYRAAPRPDEAEALRQRVVEAAESAAVGIRVRLSEGGWHVMDCERDLVAAVDALTRASSPAPSPVEAAAGRLRERMEQGPRPLILNATLGVVQKPEPPKFSEHVTVAVADLRAVLDALGAKGGE